MLIGGIPVNDPGASAPGGGGGEESPSPPQDNPGSPGDGASPSSTQYNPWSPGPTPPPPQESITPTPDQPQDTPSPSPPETSPSAPPSNGDPGLYIPPPETFIPLSTCQASIIQQMTNIYENSRVQFSYDYCENFNDGRGYTSGIVGFTTGTFDANIVVQRYVQLGGTDFNAFLATLASKGSSGSTDGLDGYCDTWRNAASNPLFRQAQDEIASSMYWSPALAKSNELGLKLPVSFGFMYDSWIQHGEGEKEGVLSMLSQVRTSPAVDEMAWLREFFNVRTTVLDTTSGWQGTSYRVRSYQYVADNSPNFGEGPIVILDNDGNPMNIECRLSLWGEYVPCYPNCG
ncbi:lysozyme-like domain-containing protein [Cladochytrium replicatum]|nr:lysozyme-like domain-containing protein [Cladochytrium replicatum]